MSSISTQAYILKSSTVLFTIVGIIIGSVRLLYQLRNGEATDGSFQRMVKLLLATGLISDVFNLTSLFIATVAGGWPLGFGACEMFGFITAVLSSCSSWVVTIATIERYFVLLLPSEVTSTFSARNVNIIVTGLYILIMMAATGPFYGFGDYTYLRGYLHILVSSNISIPHHLYPPHMKLETIHQLFSHLRRSSYTQPNTDILNAISSHLQKNYYVIVNTAKWLPHGISFYIRALDSNTLERFMVHYRDKLFIQNVSGISFIDDVATSLNISDSEVTAFVPQDVYLAYSQLYMPIQELGLCTADMTSPNHHSGVWAGFFVLISFVLPYSIVLIVLCVIYVRNLKYLPYSGKHVTENEIQHTNTMCTIAMSSCGITLFYFVVVLLSVDCVYVSSELVFWASYFVSIKSLIYIAILKYNTYSCQCQCSFAKLMRMCGFYAKGALSYEMSEFESNRVPLTGDNCSKGTKPLMTNL